MTGSFAITTFIGGFTFPFLIRLMWGDFVDKYGGLGGVLAAGFIVATTWCFNHSVGMIHQTGAWVDMGYATFGLFAANVAVDKSDVGKGFVSLILAIIGGLLGAFIISRLVV